MANKRETGRVGEDSARRFLIENGYNILYRNFRYGRYGEIDIVAQKAGVLCFVEVKARAGRRYGLPSEAVGYGKRQKILTVANHYLQTFKLFDSKIRFDVIEVYLSKPARPGEAYTVVECRHIENAFGAE